MYKMIIVEDDPMILEIYQKKFQESGFDVLPADSGEKALELAKKNKVDLVLLDLIMPKMDGFDVIKSLRQGRFDAGMKIIVSSNLSQKEERDKAIQLGADGFIVKSEFTPTGLVKEVERHMSQLKEEERNEIRRNGNGGKFQKSDGPAKKILMIEDEVVFEEIFGDKLRQDGFEVDFSENGQEGFKKALSGEYDLFVIDMVLPGLSGDEIVEKIKLEEKIKNTPIIIFSASVDDEIKRKVESLGVNAFFVKTQLVPSELAKKVRELLNIEE